MFDEPFRWMEAISTRHNYVQEKLKKGQPVLAVPFDEGVLLLGFCPQPGKIFEIYDRIALGALGHPADVERLRMTLLDLAHVEGFNRSEQDVTISRLLQFGIAPALKQNFEEVQRAPYLIQMLLVEIDRHGNPLFFRLNYDGHWETFKRGVVIGGNGKMVEWMEKEIEKRPFATYPLDKALQETCELWEQGIKHAREKDEAEGDDKERESESKIPSTLKDAFEKWILEAAVLSNKTARKSLYRTLTSEEIEKLKKKYLKS